MQKLEEFRDISNENNTPSFTDFKNQMMIYSCRKRCMVFVTSTTKR